MSQSCHIDNCHPLKELYFTNHFSVFVQSLVTSSRQCVLDPSKIQSLVLPSHSYQIITFNPQHLHVKIPAATFKCFNNFATTKSRSISWKICLKCSTCSNKSKHQNGPCLLVFFHGASWIMSSTVECQAITSYHFCWTNVKKKVGRVQPMHGTLRLMMIVLSKNT